MNIQARKLNLIQYLTQTTNASLIKMIENIIKKEDADFWNELTQEQQEDIDAGLAELQEGYKTSHNKVMKKAKSLLK